jgi:hypothetical protein
MKRIFYTAEEVAEVLRTSPRTLLGSWKDFIGYYCFPHRILFDQSDVEKFLDTQFVPPFRVRNGR